MKNSRIRGPKERTR